VRGQEFARVHGRSLVKTIDAGVIVFVTIAISLLGLMSWTVRYMDSNAFQVESEILRQQLRPVIGDFRTGLPRDPALARTWFAVAPQERAIIQKAPDATGMVEMAGERLAPLLRAEGMKAMFDRSFAAFAQKRSKDAGAEFILIGPRGGEALALVAPLTDETGVTRLAVSMVDFIGLAKALEPFSMALLPVLAPGREAPAAEGNLRLVGIDGGTAAQIAWKAQRISATVSKYILPILAVILTIGFVVLMILRGHWRRTNEAFQADLKAVEEIASTDVLTGLPNRRALFEHMRLVAPPGGAAEPVTVMMLDIDGFKGINEALGHQGGDKFLARAAKVIRGEIGEEAFVARLSGDEFIIVVPGLIEGDLLAELHADLTSALRRKADPGAGVPMSISLGAASTLGRVAGQIGSGEDLLRKADLAVLEAKNAGRGLALSYEPSMALAHTDRLKLERELRAGVANGELFVVHQPIVEAISNGIIGYESLVRWQSPTRGLVAPADFIPIAEQSELIVAIGDFVLDRAVMELAPLGKCRISVNVASRQIVARDFSAKVRAALTKYGVDPARLCLEITETSLIEDRDHVVGVMANLRGLGVRFAIDDFGVGYSSLSYLMQFKFDVLKIDKGFIESLDDNPEAPMIVTSIVSLARSLGMQVVGEGIETAAQQRFLASAGCGALQGYLFGKPQPIADVRVAHPAKAAKLNANTQAA
jgi:diguanylate cyclase (GGDEF)-like protein